MGSCNGQAKDSNGSPNDVLQEGRAGSMHLVESEMNGISGLAHAGRPERCCLRHGQAPVQRSHVERRSMVFLGIGPKAGPCGTAASDGKPSSSRTSCGSPDGTIIVVEQTRTAIVRAGSRRSRPTRARPGGIRDGLRGSARTDCCRYRPHRRGDAHRRNRHPT